MCESDYTLESTTRSRSLRGNPCSSRHFSTSLFVHWTYRGLNWMKMCESDYTFESTTRSRSLRGNPCSSRHFSTSLELIVSLRALQSLNVISLERTAGVLRFHTACFSSATLPGNKQERRQWCQVAPPLQPDLFLGQGRSIGSSINRSDKWEIRPARVKFWKIDYFRLSPTSLTW